MNENFYMTKDKRSFYLKNTHNEEDDFYQITAYETKTNKEIGFINYKIYYEREGSSSWLNLIEVTDSSYLNAGVGQTLLNAFEKDLISRRITRINGKYYPKDDGAKYSEAFYKRNGYDITMEEYGKEIYKDLDFAKVIAGQKVEKDKEK
jgi:GNAT superfamily N-acetyltransferase